MHETVRVLVVDDQPIVRSAMRVLLDAAGEFEAVGEAASGNEALSAVEQLDPDLVLLDVRMPDMDGIEAASRIQATHRRTVVVLMSSDPEVEPRASAAAPFVAKERLRTAVLRELWTRHAPAR
ncbi:MAG TPA: response regulator [Thermoleophilaceae bacterium]